jgi:hypothetical protein
MLSEDYIVGLTDGEGSFCTYIREPDKKTWNTRVECHFYIKMREDELPLLRKVKQFFACGRIDFQKESRVNQRDSYRFQISDIKNLKNEIIPFFRKNRLMSQRYCDFKLFCRIVDMVYRKRHFTKRGITIIKKIKSQMHK